MSIRIHMSSIRISWSQPILSMGHSPILVYFSTLIPSADTQSFINFTGRPLEEASSLILSIRTYEFIGFSEHGTYYVEASEVTVSSLINPIATPT